MRWLPPVLGLLASCTPEGAESGVSADSFDTTTATKTDVPETLTDFLPGVWSCDWVCSLFGDRKDVAHSWTFEHDGVDGLVTSNISERMAFAMDNGATDACTFSIGVTDGWLRGNEPYLTIEDSPWWAFGSSRILVELETTTTGTSYGSVFELEVIDEDHFVMNSSPNPKYSLIQCARDQGTE